MNDILSQLFVGMLPSNVRSKNITELAWNLSSNEERIRLERDLAQIIAIGVRQTWTYSPESCRRV